jgi:hypothetical protein
MTRSQKQRWGDLQPKTCKSFVWSHVAVNLYAPWWAPSRNKRELGFMVRVRDPRGCTHEHLIWRSPNQEGVTQWVPYCPDCKRTLSRKRDRRHGPRWLWVKVFVATTLPSRARPHRVFVAEAETHLTDNALARVTTKTFVRLKVGRGGPYV